MPATCLIGFDAPEVADLTSRLPGPVVARDMLPRVRLTDGTLSVEAETGGPFVAVERVIFHGIFEDDVEFLAALVLWGGPCLPNPRGMLDLRLKLPGLVRALPFTRFPIPGRGYASPGVEITVGVESIAKWGNRHCGDNKERFTDVFVAREPTLIEPFVAGESVRVVMIGETAWQLRLGGDTWLKSVHHREADFMPIDEELLADTRAIRDGFGLELIANDYVVTPGGAKHLLEVNHIPSVTCFPELWAAYRSFVADWAG